MHAGGRPGIVGKTLMPEAIMIERRHNARTRVIYSGVIAYDERRATMNCVIRNFSEDGVKVEFENTALLPDAIRSADRQEGPCL